MVKTWLIRIWLGVVVAGLLGLAAFSLWAFIWLGLGMPAAVEAQSKFTVSNVTGSGFMVSWVISDSEAGFTLYAYLREGGQNQGRRVNPDGTRGSLLGDARSGTFSGLRCGSTYRVSFTPHSGSRVGYERYDVQTAACPAADFDVSDVTDKGFKAAWGRFGFRRMSSFTLYALAADGTRFNPTGSAGGLLSAGDTEASFTGLSCETLYLVYFTITGGGSAGLKQRDVTTGICPPDVINPNPDAPDSSDYFRITDQGRNTRLGRTSLLVEWATPGGFTVGNYEVTLAPAAGGLERYPEGHETGRLRGQLPVGTNRALFGGLECATEYVVTFRYQSVRSQAKGMTAPCVEPLPLYDGDNALAKKLCYRLPGCPPSLVFLVPLVVAAGLMGAVRNVGIALGGGAIAYLVLGTLLMPNPFIYIFFVAAMGAAVLLWRMVR